MPNPFEKAIGAPQGAVCAASYVVCAGPASPRRGDGQRHRRGRASVVVNVTVQFPFRSPILRLLFELRARLLLILAGVVVPVNLSTLTKPPHSWHGIVCPR